MAEVKSTFGAEDVEDLVFDFTKWVQDETLGTLKGVIPEPSDNDIKAFRKAFANMINRMSPDAASTAPKRAPAKTDMLAQIKLVAEHLEKDDSEYTLEMASAIGKLCRDMPNSDVFLALPYRVKQSFMGWIVGIFLTPGKATP